MTEEEYEAALAEMDRIWDLAVEDMLLRKRLIELCDAVEAYEDEHYPMD